MNQVFIETDLRREDRTCLRRHYKSYDVKKDSGGGESLSSFVSEDTATQISNPYLYSCPLSLVVPESRRPVGEQGRERTVGGWRGAETTGPLSGEGESLRPASLCCTFDSSLRGLCLNGLSLLKAAVLRHTDGGLGSAGDTGRFVSDTPTCPEAVPPRECAPVSVDVRDPTASQTSVRFGPKIIRKMNFNTLPTTRCVSFWCPNVPTHSLTSPAGSSAVRLSLIQGVSRTKVVTDRSHLVGFCRGVDRRVSCILLGRPRVYKESLSLSPEAPWVLGPCSGSEYWQVFCH